MDNHIVCFVCYHLYLFIDGIYVNMLRMRFIMNVMFEEKSNVHTQVWLSTQINTYTNSHTGTCVRDPMLFIYFVDLNNSTWWAYLMLPSIQGDKSYMSHFAWNFCRIQKYSTRNVQNKSCMETKMARNFWPLQIILGGEFPLVYISPCCHSFCAPSIHKTFKMVSEIFFLCVCVFE